MPAEAARTTTRGPRTLRRRTSGHRKSQGRGERDGAELHERDEPVHDSQSPSSTTRIELPPASARVKATPVAVALAATPTLAPSLDDATAIGVGSRIVPSAARWIARIALCPDPALSLHAAITVLPSDAAASAPIAPAPLATRKPPSGSRRPPARVKRLARSSLPLAHSTTKVSP